MRQLSRYVERILRQRRPRPFVPTDDEAAVIRAAIALRAVRPEAALPRAEFVTALHGRLAERMERAGEPETGEAGPAGSPGGRRRMLIGASAAAATAVVSAAAAVTVDRALTDPGVPAAAGTLSPVDGFWHPVLESAALAEGGAHAFDTGTVTGFVMRAGGRLSARSGVCTHQGCQLSLNLAARRLDCPCHRTLFAFDGMAVQWQLPSRPAQLPAIEVRESEGQIEVFVPRR
jgi:cytochrome b6-f complex iron-sulfur subunit